MDTNKIRSAIPAIEYIRDEYNVAAVAIANKLLASHIDDIEEAEYQLHNHYKAIVIRCNDLIALMNK